MSENEKEENKVASFIKGSSILILSNVCLKAINFFLLPLYTNSLNPEMIGISDSITTLTGIMLPLLIMGLDAAYSAFYFDKTDPKRGDKVFSTLVISFLFIGVVPILFISFSRSVSQLLFHNKDFSYIITFAFISVSFNLWYLPYTLELRLRNKMFLFGVSNVITSLSMVILNILFVTVLQLGEASLVLSTMIVHIEHYALVLLLVRKKPSLKEFDITLLTKMLKFSIPLIPMALMMWVLSLSDRYVLLYYHGESDVGIYGIGLRFTNLLNVIISAVSMAYTTFAFSSKEDNNSKKQYYYIYNIESIILIVITFSITLFGREVIQLMTSSSYNESYVTLRDLLFAQIFYAMSTIIGYGIYFEKKSYYSLIAVTAGAIINLGLNFLLIPKYGIQAAAFTTLIGYMVNYFLTLFFSEKVYPCNYGQIRILLTISVVYFVCYFCSNLSIILRILIWLICIAILLVIYKKIIVTIFKYIVKWLKNKKSNSMENPNDK